MIILILAPWFSRLPGESTLNRIEVMDPQMAGECTAGCGLTITCTQQINNKICLAGRKQKTAPLFGVWDLWYLQ